MINNQPDFSSRGFLTRMWDLIPCLSFPKPFPSSHPCEDIHSKQSKQSRPHRFSKSPSKTAPHDRSFNPSLSVSVSLFLLVLPRPPEMSRLSEFSTQETTNRKTKVQHGTSYHLRHETKGRRVLSHALEHHRMLHLPPPPFPAGFKPFSKGNRKKNRIEITRAPLLMTITECCDRHSSKTLNSS